MATLSELAPKQVHIWLVDLNVGTLRHRALARYLSDDETERARRFHFDRDRDRFIRARGLLRELLGAYADRHPRSFQFSYGPFGKPALHGASGQTPAFNISHSADVGLFAFTRNGAIGVDIEEIGEDDGCFMAIALQYYSAKERALLDRLEPAARWAEFYLYWTRREAYLKATGDGMNRLSTDLELYPGLNQLGCVATAEWTIETIKVDSGYAASVAVEGSGWSFELYRHADGILGRRTGTNIHEAL
jgi:4'-phosphopantetheinyl transferase